MKLGCMSQVFVSYARSTAAQADAIAIALRDRGLEVWRDNQIPPHRAYTDVIEEELRGAKAVVAVWSAEAVASEWVRSEANRAREDRKLVQVTVDGTQPPMPFDQIHCADLSAWTGDLADPEWLAVVASVEELVATHKAGRRQAKPRGPKASKGGSLAAAAPLIHLAPFAPPPRLSIAVLPFKALAGQAYLAEAIAEDLVTALARWRWFLVIARNSSFRYRSRTPDIRRIGTELGVRYALEGSIRKLGTRIRVSMQLSDALTGLNVWAEQIDCPLVDILRLQDEVTERVVAAIEPEIRLAEGARMAHMSLSDFNALDCYYRGMWHLNRLTQTDDVRARKLFLQAIEKDPDLSLGYIGLARVLYGEAIFGWASDGERTLQDSADAARRAIALDARDACGHFALSGAALYLGEHVAALANARRAIELNPNFAYAHYRLGQVLIFSGEPAEAIEPIKRSLRLSPCDPQASSMLETLALAHYQARDFENAITYAEAGASAAGLSGSSVRAASLARLGRFQQAASEFQAANLSPPSPNRPRAAPYAKTADAEFLRDGFRLAGAPLSASSPMIPTNGQLADPEASSG